MFNEKIKETITIELEDGKEIEMRVLLTFEDEKNNESYVFYFDEEGEVEEVFPFLFDKESEDLKELEEERQWEMAEEVLEKFLEEENFNEEKKED